MNDVVTLATAAIHHLNAGWALTRPFLYIYLLKNTGTGLPRSGGRTAPEIVLVGMEPNNILNHRQTRARLIKRGTEGRLARGRGHMRSGVPTPNTDAL